VETALCPSRLLWRGAPNRRIDSPWGAAIVSRHVGRGPGFIDKYQLFPGPSPAALHSRRAERPARPRALASVACLYPRVVPTNYKVFTKNLQVTCTSTKMESEFVS